VLILSPEKKVSAAFYIALEIVDGNHLLHIEVHYDLMAFKVDQLIDPFGVVGGLYVKDRLHDKVGELYPF
jgi:hypothetical protein